MKLSGEQVEQIQNALLDGYVLDSLNRMVRVHLDQNLAEIVTMGNFKNVVYDLLTWAERTDNINALIAGAHEDNPHNQQIADLMTELSIPVSDGNSGVAAKDSTTAKFETSVSGGSVDQIINIDNLDGGLTISND